MLKIPERRLKLAGQLSIRRKRLEERGLLPGVSNQDGPIAIQLGIIKAQLQKDEFDFAELGLLKLRYLCDRLDEIAARDKRSWKYFLGQLRTHRLDDYLGATSELNLASILARNGIEFRRPDPPDFQIGDAQAAANIECSSAHVDGDTNKDLTYKINSAINRKKEKPYCNSSTALMIDMTNVMYRSHLTGWNMDPLQLKEQLTKPAQESGFGSILLQCQIGSLHAKRVQIELAFLRIDGKERSPELQMVLDKCFPPGEYAIEHAVFPRMS